jgi:hypothetical protein
VPAALVHVICVCETVMVQDVAEYDLDVAEFAYDAVTAERSPIVVAALSSTRGPKLVPVSVTVCPAVSMSVWAALSMLVRTGTAYVEVSASLPVLPSFAVRVKWLRAEIWPPTSTDQECPLPVPATPAQTSCVELEYVHVPFTESELSCLSYTLARMLLTFNATLGPKLVPVMVIEWEPSVGIPTLLAVENPRETSSKFVIVGGS